MLTAIVMVCLGCPAEMGQENIGEAKPHANKFNFIVWKAEFPKEIVVDSEITVPVILLNNGTEAWDVSKDKPLFLSYHWKHPGGRFDSKMFWGLKNPLPAYVGVNELIEVEMKIKAPDKPKYYDLIVDIVRGNSEIRDEVSWFEEAGGKTCDIRLEVLANEKQ